MILETLLNDPISIWIHKKFEAKLTGRTLSCAINFWSYLIRAQKIAPTLAFFCATHATEEAVAAFVLSAKINGCSSLATQLTSITMLKGPSLLRMLKCYQD